MPASLGTFENMSAKDVDNTLQDLFVATDDCYFVQLDISGPTTTGVQIELTLFRTNGSLETIWLPNVPLPVGATLQVLEGTKLVLKAGDKIRGRCVTPAETIDVFGSYVNDVNA